MHHPRCGRSAVLERAIVARAGHAVAWLVVAIGAIGLVAGPLSGQEGQSQSDAGSTLERVRRPNEPAGFRMLTNRPFADRQETGWETRRDPTFRIVDDPTAPVSPPHVGVAVFPPNFRGGRGPIDTYFNLPGGRVRDLYLTFWMKFPGNFQGSPSVGINKILHIWLAGKSVVVFSAQGRGRNALLPQMRLQNVQSDPRGISFNLDPRAGGRPSRLERDRWYQIEVLLRLNEAGRRDGSVRWWVDGDPAGLYDNIGFLRGDRDGSWDRVSWNPTWGSPKDQTSSEMRIMMDHFYISARP